MLSDTASTSAGMGSRSHSVALGVALLLVCALHVTGISLYFRPSQWLSDQPFYTNGYAFHYARGLAAAAELRHHLRLWGYSPALMAGYPAGTRTEPAGQATALWLWASSWLTGPLKESQSAPWTGGPAIAYKLLVLGLLTAAPAASGVTAWALGLGRGGILLAAMLGAMGVFSIPGIGMIRAGMFAFLSACYLSPAAGALMARRMRKPIGPALVLLVLATGLVTYLHPLTLLLLAPAAAGSVIDGWRAQRWEAVLGWLGVGLIALPWLAPVVLTLGLGIEFSNWWLTPTSWVPAMRQLIECRLGLPPLILAILAWWGLREIGGSLPMRAGWGLGTGAFMLGGYFGSMGGILNQIEPARLEVAFFYYAAPLAAVGICRAWGGFGGRRRFKLIARPSLALAGLAGLLVTLSVITYDLDRHETIKATVPPQARDLSQWIETWDPASRLMVEAGWTYERDTLRLPFFGADLGMLWAVTLNHELIGASADEGFSLYSFTSLSGGRAFGRDLSAWDAAGFQRSLETYNIGGALIWSDEAKDFFSRLAYAHLLTASGPYHLLGFSGEHSPLAEGDAQAVRATTDCIRVIGAKAGRLVLRYHYFKTLRAAGGVRLSPVAVGNGDPIPFIALEHPSAGDITVYNAGFLGLDRPYCEPGG